MVGSTELANACALVIEAYKTDADFKAAFIASTETAVKEMRGENLSNREIAVYVSERILGID